MKVYSWNVNGIRAAVKKGFIDWFNRVDGDIICLQEVKAFSSQLDSVLHSPKGYHSYWHNGLKKGYAGVATYSKVESTSVCYDFDKMVDMFKEDGRIIQTEYDSFILLNIYFPNGNPRVGEEDVLSKKLKFYEYFLSYLNSLRDMGKSIIACGDYNIAHTEIDIARPKENKNSIGFLPIERECLDMVLSDGYVDVFRHFNPEVRDTYSWWSYRSTARDRNIGWRIDYFFISPDLVDRVKDVGHEHDVIGSDHCPIYLEID
jgi:exodeoxyribonuclease-3